VRKKKIAAPAMPRLRRIVRAAMDAFAVVERPVDEGDDEGLEMVDGIDGSDRADDMVAVVAVARDVDVDVDVGVQAGSVTLKG
jgi:hypothetical protein